jgi:hypothetical protein
VVALRFSDSDERTVDAALDSALSTLARHGVNATATRTIGLWNGERETGFLVETITADDERDVLRLYQGVAARLALAYAQNSVLVTRGPGPDSMVFVDGPGTAVPERIDA